MLCYNSVPAFFQCTDGALASVSLTPAVLVARWQGCSGGAIIEAGPSHPVDLCGVCGGDNSTCKDCNGVIKGGEKSLILFSKNVSKRMHRFSLTQLGVYG